MHQARNTLAILFLLLMTGCADKYQEGYQAGYVQGSIEAETRLHSEYEEKIAKLERERRDTGYGSVFSSTSTEVCGDSGVNLNGKHYSGGKTGCVKVFSDGRVERY